MSAKLRAYLNFIPAHQKLMIGLFVILASIVIVGFVSMSTDQVIASPGLRVQSWLWKVFVCRCPI